MKSRVYVDGFNLYYGCLKGGRYRWLDPRGVAQQIFANDEIDHTRYFTARVKSDPRNMGRSQRQATYLRALATLDRLTIHEGRYEIRKKKGRLVAKKKIVEVLVPEEKGSDVNLASWLLLDGFRGLYERAVVISNDSDLAEPIKMVHRELGLKVAILAPILLPDRWMSGELKKSTKVIREIRQSALKNSQLPPEIYDAQGAKITRPVKWQ